MSRYVGKSLMVALFRFAKEIECETTSWHLSPVSGHMWYWIELKHSGRLTLSKQVTNSLQNHCRQWHPTSVAVVAVIIITNVFIVVTLTTHFVSVFRIMLCAMCGDPYPVELILGPLLHHQNCWRSSTRPDTIILETYLGFDRKRVQITLTSYHRRWCSCDSRTKGSLTGGKR